MGQQALTPWQVLMDAQEGDPIALHVDDFDNTAHPKDENPRDIAGTIEGANDDVDRAAGEICRVVAIGDPHEGGCLVDLGDKRENMLVDRTGAYSAAAARYTKVWRPRTGRSRELLGQVVGASTEP